MVTLVYRGVICLPPQKSPYNAWPSETNRNPGDPRWAPPPKKKSEAIVGNGVK